jgi:hypothetical protein
VEIGHFAVWDETRYAGSSVDVVFYIETIWNNGLPGTDGEMIPVFADKCTSPTETELQYKALVDYLGVKYFPVWQIT